MENKPIPEMSKMEVVRTYAKALDFQQLFAIKHSRVISVDQLIKKEEVVEVDATTRKLNALEKHFKGRLQRCKYIPAKQKQSQLMSMLEKMIENAN